MSLSATSVVSFALSDLSFSFPRSLRSQHARTHTAHWEAMCEINVRANGFVAPHRILCINCTAESTTNISATKTVGGSKRKEMQRKITQIKRQKKARPHSMRNVCIHIYNYNWLLLLFARARVNLLLFVPSSFRFRFSFRSSSNSSAYVVHR